MITADAIGNWRIWEFDDSSGEWAIKTQPTMDGANRECHFAMFSPKGKRVLAGIGENAVIWKLDEEGHRVGDQEVHIPGKVQTAAFAADGSWIVTFDGNRSLNIRDSSGTLLDWLKETDAVGITALTLSSDRRRLITAHGKRIVIWDTSRIIDSGPREKALTDAARRSEADRSDTGKLLSTGRRKETLIRELLTIEATNEIESITSISISPDGRNLLASDAGGKTIIWKGEPITPISISFSNDRIGYQRDSGPKIICERAVLNDPSGIADFGDAVLTVSTSSESIGGESLQLRSTYDSLAADSAEPTIEIVKEEDEGMRTLEYRARPDSDAVRIGVLQTTKNENATIKISLTDAADSAGIQALLRALTYEINSQTQMQTSVSATEVVGIAAEESVQNLSLIHI